MSHEHHHASQVGICDSEVSEQVTFMNNNVWCSLQFATYTTFFDFLCELSSKGHQPFKNTVKTLASPTALADRHQTPTMLEWEKAKNMIRKVNAPIDSHVMFN